MQKEYILPLAITQVDSTFACVAGLTNQNAWIRPEPVYIEDIRSGFFRYEHLTEILYNQTNAPEARKEDKSICRENLYELNIKHDNNVCSRIKKILDKSLDTIFDNERTVGIVKIEITDITYGKTLGGKKNFRIIFIDSKREHNLIIADYYLKHEIQQQLVNDELPKQSKINFITKYSNMEIFLTVSLTKPTPFPGPYNGCHAIAAGFHHY